MENLYYLPLTEVKTKIKQQQLGNVIKYSLASDACEVSELDTFSLCQKGD